MRVLVVYATTEGQTRKIAERIAARLSASGHAPTLVDATRAGPDTDPAAFDLSILAGSLHEGRYQAALVDFARRHAAALNAGESAFVSVSLSAAGDDPGDWAGLARCIETFRSETGWSAERLHHAAGAFRFTRYDFLKSWAMRFIAYRRGESVDPHADTEYTDWDALDAFVDEVAQPGAAAAS
ncbi:flavodoxin domain-containing protein [Salinarimonas chemoclinalis]|uniref:flavodoxin domain-containing protein n=1 Tax=Salinarimonas chemoclinalis TaxID=3241599 RepID=UPI003557971F